MASLTRSAVLRIIAESRDTVLDRRDVELPRSIRFDLPNWHASPPDHERGETEPLLWLADIDAGAVRLAREGRTSCRGVLADRLTVIKVNC